MIRLLPDACICAGMQVFFAIAFAAIGIANAQMAFPDLTKASGAVKRVFSVIDRVPAILPNLGAGKICAHGGVSLAAMNSRLLLPHVKHTQHGNCAIHTQPLQKNRPLSIFNPPFHSHTHEVCTQSNIDWSRRDF